MCKAAVVNSTDQSALADIAMNAEDAEVRLAAVTRLTDPALLAKVAMNDEEWHLHRMAAAERLKKLSGVAGDYGGGV